MEALANNAEAGPSGIFRSIVDGKPDGLRQETLNWAIAQKLDIGSAQQANEHALMTVTKAKGSTADLQQALKARAAIYGKTLDPAHFRKGVDLSSKIKNHRDRRRARGMFIGAPLLVAQVGAHNIRKMLNDGDRSTLQNMRLDTRGTAGQLLKALSKAPILQIIERINADRYKKLREGLLQQADDFDFLQSVVTSVLESPSLNPSMNAITDAFNRRRFSGRFRTAGRGIEMDTLLYQSTKGVKDDDDISRPVGNTGVPNQQSRNRTGGEAQHCYAFQSGSCHRGNLCT